MANLLDDFSGQRDAEQSVRNAEGGLPARLSGRSFLVLREKMQYAGSLRAYSPLGKRRPRAVDPTIACNNAFGGLLNAHSHKSMNFLRMKDAITEQCDIFLAMFDNTPDLVAEKIAEQCEEDRRIEADSRVKMMLARISVTAEGCKLLTNIAGDVEEEELSEFSKVLREELCLR
jgi:hypothetical protein